MQLWSTREGYKLDKPCNYNSLLARGSLPEKERKQEAKQPQKSY